MENLEKTGTEEGEHLAFNCLYKVVMWYARYVLCNIIVLDTSFHRFPSFFFYSQKIGGVESCQRWLFVISQCHILFEGMYLMKMVNEVCSKSEVPLF